MIWYRDSDWLNVGQVTLYTREAGVGRLSLAMEGPSKSDIYVEDLKQGTCDVSYTCTQPGMSACLFVSLSVCLSLSFSLCLLVCLSLSTCLSFSLSVYVFVCMSVYMSI